MAARIRPFAKSKSSRLVHCKVCSPQTRRVQGHRRYRFLCLKTGSPPRRTNRRQSPPRTGRYQN
jgi:hypothetical protein